MEEVAVTQGILLSNVVTKMSSPLNVKNVMMETDWMEMDVVVLVNIKSVETVYINHILSPLKSAITAIDLGAPIAWSIMDGTAQKFPKDS